MNNRIDAIYARQSVDKKDSISIESQIEFCKYELKGGNCKEYTDKGYSGKNTDRPKFQELVRDIKQGLIAKVVVYKLDRISRSILDFANMMELFQQYNVEFVSSTEKFDTSTPMGRAMLNICIVFAQLERETIQKRVQDAWYSRCQRGFKMGGKTPYGFRTEPYVMDGVRTKKLVIEPTEAAFVRQMYEMYADPQVSLHDITKKLTADKKSGKPGFGDMAMTAMFIGLVSTYMGRYIGGFVSENGLFTFNGDYIPLIVLAVSALVMAGFVYLIEKKKQAWVDSFSIAGSMIAGMLAAVLAGLL